MTRKFFPACISLKFVHLQTTHGVLRSSTAQQVYDPSLYGAPVPQRQHQRPLIRHLPPASA